MSVNEFDPPDRFVAGTVGPPGQRTFFLQASEGRRLSSVSLEKQQVSVLADRINDLLDSYAGGAGETMRRPRSRTTHPSTPPSRTSSASTR